MSKESLKPEEIQQIQHLNNLLEEEQYYQLFSIEPSASQEDIQTAYYKLSRQWHPDRFFRRELGEYEQVINTIFMGITKAYRTLYDPQERLTYDRTHAIEHKNETVRTKDRSYVRHKGKRRRARERQKTTNTNTTPRKTLREERRDRVLQQLDSKLQEKKKQAKDLFDDGMQKFAANEVIKAAAAMHLACKLDPENKDYLAKYREVRGLARKAKANELFAQAENAENFQNYAHALDLYRKTVEYEIESPQAYARLAYLLDKLDPDPRETLRLLQIAVQKDPENIDYCCRLGEAYASQGLILNARREFTKVLKLDKGNERAKEGLSNLK